MWQVNPPTGLRSRIPRDTRAFAWGRMGVGASTYSVWYRPTMAGRLTHQIVVRVSDELHRLLVADSEKHGRTIAQTVRLHLTHHYLPDHS